MNRRRFLQISALACAAPAINKIDSIVTLNVDSCIPKIIPHSEVVFWDNINSQFSPIDMFRETAEQLLINGHIPGKSKMVLIAN